MGRDIEVLDKNTIDQIAAGEVVERPASVIKELVENAIDALATAITIEIKDGGTSLIRITDNGGGIPKDQIRKAFMRHATSKIRSATDLETVASLGFRGEALSSIASVSRMECITRTPDALTGVRYVIDGGEEKECEEIGAPSGTTFLVRNLFFNVPVRARFMKSPQAEGNQCAICAEELALSHPEISFKFIMNGQNRMYTSGNGNLKEIVYQIYGRDLTKELIPVDASSDLMKVHGFVGSPNASRGNRNFENYFINRRYVKNQVITKAIEDAFHGFLMQHRYPFTLLYLDIDFRKVDVNVHPRKLEVRLSDQEALYHTLCLAIQNALMNRERIPSVSLDKEKQENKDGGARLPVLPKNVPEPFERVRREQEAAEQIVAEIPSYGPESGKPMADQGFRPSADRAPAATADRNSAATADRNSAAAADRNSAAMADRGPAEHAGGLTAGPDHGHDTAAGHAGEGDHHDAAAGSAVRPAGPEMTQETAQETVKQSHVSTTAPAKTEQMSLFKEDRVLSEQARRQFRFIGQIFDTYWLIEYRDSLYIIDQHAAHEKVNYERLMKNYREKKISSQMLYPADILNLSAKEASAITRHMDSFEALGFDIEPFGGTSFRVNAVPDNLFGVRPEDLFTEILAHLDDTGSTDPKVITDRIATMACKASVKGNNILSEKEAEALIDELLTLENPYNCPHGRPTIISITKYELDRKFRRIV